MNAFLLVITFISLCVGAGGALVAWRLIRESRERSAARVAALAEEIESDPPEEAPQRLFATTDETRRLGRAVPLIFVSVLLVGVMAATAALGTGAESGGTRGTSKALELLSLTHAVKDNGLHITGLVRNPDGNETVTQVVAVVFVFDAKNNFLSSARAPLDFTNLGSGEESPFVVTIPAAESVGRYRVSFRRLEGGLIPHVDKRGVTTP